MSIVLLQGLAQTNPTKHYTQTNGLISNILYQALGDNKGYMWFATDRGLSRYDGFEFVSYDIDKGLPDNEIFKLYQDSKHRMWLLAYNGKPCYIKNDSVHTNENTAILEQFDNTDFFTEVVESEKRTLCFFKEYANYFYSFDDSKIKKQLLPTQTYYISQFVYKKNNYIIYNERKADGIWIYYIATNEDPRTVVSSFEARNQLRKFICVNDVIYFLDNGEANYENAKIVFSTDLSFKHTSTIDLNSITFSLCNEVNYDGEAINWSSNNGLIRYHVKTKKLDHFLESEKVTSCKADFEGGTWLTTLNNGVYYFNNKQSDLYNKIQIPVFLIKPNKSNNKEIIFCSEGQIVKESHGKHITYPFTDVSKTEIITDAVFLPNGNVLIGNGTGLYLIEDNRIEKIKGKSGIKQILLDGDSILYATSTGLIKQHINQLKMYVDESNRQFRVLSKNRSLSVIKYNTKGYLVGNNNGVEIIPSSSDTTFKAIHHRIKRIIKSQNGTIAFCSDVKGVNILRNKQLYHFTTENGLISNQVNNAVFDKANNLWIATKKGVSFLNTTSLKITNYSSVNGIRIENINDLFILNDTCILLATSTGVYKFNPKARHNITFPRIDIRNLKVNARFVNVSALHHLSYQENNIELLLSGISYNDNELDFYYQLNPESQWKKINGRLLTFVNMPSGNYNLRLKCKNEYNLWSNEIVIPINIHPPFYMTWWFLISINGLLIGLILLVVFYFLKRKIKEREIKLILSETKQQALRAQLNPHFVFNALNSIQYLYLSKKEEEAQHYLSKFSVLLRNTLNHTDKTQITIQEEIESIQLYLEIEQIRSAKKFDFKIITDDTINTYNISIPSMLLQPFVENSVWHGFKKIPHKGMITIIVSDVDQQFVKISIKDNGSGYDINKEKNENSKGTKLIFDRITALNMVNSSKIIYTITSNAQGTLIEFTLPKIY